MLTLLQVKTPLELVKDLQTLLEDLESLHAREVEEVLAAFKIKALAVKAPAEQKKIVDEFNLKQGGLKHRATRMTMQNILRHFLKTGIRQYRGRLPQLLAEINSSGISRGRPKV